MSVGVGRVMCVILLQYGARDLWYGCMRLYQLTTEQFVDRGAIQYNSEMISSMQGSDCRQGSNVDRN